MACKISTIKTLALRHNSGISLTIVIALFVYLSKVPWAIQLIGTYNLVSYIIENSTYIKFQIFVVVRGWVFTDKTQELIIIFCLRLKDSYIHDALDIVYQSLQFYKGLPVIYFNIEIWNEHASTSIILFGGMWNILSTWGSLILFVFQLNITLLLYNVVYLHIPESYGNLHMALSFGVNDCLLFYAIKPQLVASNTMSECYQNKPTNTCVYTCVWMFILRRIYLCLSTAYVYQTLSIMDKNEPECI